MNYSNEFRVGLEDRDDEIKFDDFFRVGFLQVERDEKSVLLRLPPGWSFSPDSEIKNFIDKEGNVRGSAGNCYAYLRCRYELATKSNTDIENDSMETARLYVLDNKTGEEIMYLGKYEPFSDYEKDLRAMARMLVFRKYSDWENPAAYWDD